MSGLQCLIELRINNNSIKSIRHLRGLPALKELHCSGNNLKTLDGIQFFPQLEIIHAGKYKYICIYV